jgi:hypothetical protein
MLHNHHFEAETQTKNPERNSSSIFSKTRDRREEDQTDQSDVDLHGHTLRLHLVAAEHHQSFDRLELFTDVVLEILSCSVHHLSPDCDDFGLL